MHKEQIQDFFLKFFFRYGRQKKENNSQKTQVTQSAKKTLKNKLRNKDITKKELAQSDRCEQ